MGKRKTGKQPQTWTEKQPLPVSEISRNARHGKTVNDLSDAGDLPVNVLEKEIPANDMHDM